MRILLIEDEDGVAGPLIKALGQRGLTTDHARDRDEAEAYLQSMDYTAVLLDLGLPDGDGIELLAAMRARGDTRPVLVLTARASVPARILGLNQGADEYMIKPFDVDELYARLLAVLRRRDGYCGVALRCGDLSFAADTRTVSVGPKILTLSVRETELLELLLRRVGKVVPKSIIEDQLFGLDGDLGSNAVEVYAHRLRKRLDESLTAARITTIRGIGYMLAEAA